MGFLGQKFIKISKYWNFESPSNWTFSVFYGPKNPIRVEKIIILETLVTSTGQQTRLEGFFIKFKQFELE